MIDWANLAANAAWILGCALALAAFSYGSWQASVYHEKLRQRLAQPGFLAAFSLAGVLFSAGLAALSETTLRLGLWALLAFLFFASFVLALWRRRVARA
jgi:hypothetical protein